MSSAGCPYDNAIMERFLILSNTNTETILRLQQKERMNSIMNDFEQKRYNSKRQHTFNNGLSPNQVNANSPLM